MRVTANTMPDALVAQLARLTTRQAQLQNQVSTGQRLTWPEEDPVAMRRVLDFQTEAKAVVQYQRNVALLREAAQTQYQVLRGLQQILDRASELAILADDTKSPEELKIYAIEITQLLKQAVQLTETRFRGSFMFSGTLSNQPPFAISSDAAGNVTRVVYQGNQNVPKNEIAEGIVVSLDVVGANNSGSGPRGLVADSRFGADLFNHLIDLQNHLLAGDTAAIANSDRPALSQDEDNLLLHLGNNGAMQARLEASKAILATRGQSLAAQVSHEADADLAETIVRLNQVQIAYQAALQSGARLLSTSLLDFIR